MERYEIMNTNDGYMIWDKYEEDYVHDNLGNNLWDTMEEVNNVLNQII
jgi:hypothetical protein